MKTATVKLKSAFFLTDEGAAALTAYKAWDKPTVDSDDDVTKQRKQALIDAGLLKEAATITGGYKDRVKAILKDKKARTAQEITDNLNDVLKEEAAEGEKPETTTLKNVQFWLSVHGEKNGIKEKNGKYSI